MSKLSHPVLLLNKSWVPIAVVSVKKAIGLIHKGKAKAVDAEDYTTYEFESWSDLGQIFEDIDVVKTPRFRIPIPEVVVLTTYSKVLYHKITFSRYNLLERDNFICQYCSGKVKTSNFTIDHIVPKSKPGGVTSWTNCVISCIKCNRKKGCKTLKESGMKLLRQPIVPPKRHMRSNIGLMPKKISWEKFLKSSKARDDVASEVYWNAALKG